MEEQVPEVFWHEQIHQASCKREEAATRLVRLLVVELVEVRDDPPIGFRVEHLIQVFDEDVHEVQEVVLLHNETVVKNTEVSSHSPGSLLSLNSNFE
jgi:hypothetical protein